MGTEMHILCVQFISFFAKEKNNNERTILGNFLYILIKLISSDDRDEDDAIIISYVVYM